jgi:hypothetical protein
MRLPEDFFLKHKFSSIYGKSKYPANQISKWCDPVDTEEQFNAFISNPIKKNLLEANGWTVDSITYEFNNYGFRTPDNFNIKKPLEGDMYVGCSFTVGSALNITDTWAYKVWQTQQGAFYNLGQCGAGIDTCYRLMKSWIPVLKPRKVYILGFFDYRTEIFTDEGKLISLRPSNQNLSPLQQTLFDEFYTSRLESALSMIRTFDAIRYIGHEHKVDILMPSLELLKTAEQMRHGNQCGFARDLCHPGKKYHNFLSDNIEQWKKIN